MELTNIQKLFNNSYNYDSKHINNTCNKNIPGELIDNVENNGITIEQLNELIKRGYDVYKYQTQITLHGYSRELNHKLFGYKSVFQNKNLSIGIKWRAVDKQKKLAIISKLNYFGWRSVDNCNDLYPCMIERFSDLDKAIAKSKEYKIIADRIDKKIFFGSYDIYIGSYLGVYYACFDLRINGILEKNITPLLEQILAINEVEMNKRINEIEEEKQMKREAWKKEYEARRELEKKENEEKNKIIMNKLENDFNLVDSLTLNAGDVFYTTRKDYSGLIIATGYTFGKRTCKPLSCCSRNEQIYCKSHCNVYVKK